MPAIYLGFIDKATVTQTKNGRDVNLYLPERPRTTLTPITHPTAVWLSYANRILDGEPDVDIASPKYPVTTPCAGAISVFYDGSKPTHVSFSQKDKGAPRDPGFRVPRNGYPRSEADWSTMDHLVAEAFEEGIALTRSGELCLSLDSAYDSAINKVAENISAESGLKIKGTVRIPLTFKKMDDRLCIYNHRDVRIYKDSGAFSFTPETGYNFIKKMQIEYPAEELILVDGETFPKDGIIGRDICLIPISQIKGKRFGAPIMEKVYRHTRENGKLTGRIEEFRRQDRFYTDKVPRSFLCQLRDENGESIYPVDWMRETKQLFSTPYVLNQWMLRLREIEQKPGEGTEEYNKRLLGFINGNIWSTLEREAFEAGKLR